MWRRSRPLNVGWRPRRQLWWPHSATSPPNEIKLSFSERLEPAYSTVRVVDASGAEVDRQDAHVDPLDPLVLRASLKRLDPGAYTVTWRALSLDPHMSEGHFSFQVE